MLTDYNAKQLCILYKMCETTYHSYLEEHREHLKALATKRIKKGRLIIRRNYNSAQLEYLVEKVFKDTPEGYTFNGQTLISVKD